MRSVGMSCGGSICLWLLVKVEVWAWWKRDLDSGMCRWAQCLQEWGR